MGLVHTLGGITFGDNTPDANGAIWRIAKAPGWDSPSFRGGQPIESTGRHGVSQGRLLYGGRAIIPAGTCVTPTEAAYYASRDRLAGATNLLTPAPLVVHEPTVKRAYVTRDGQVRMEPFGGTGGFEFEIPLLAPDPRKYADTASSVAIPATVTNSGNFDTWPILTIVGSAAGPILATKGGKTVQLNVSLLGGQTLVADFATATVTISGALRNDVVDSTTSWWSLGAGANVVTYSGGGAPTLDYRSAWI